MINKKLIYLVIFAIMFSIFFTLDSLVSSEHINKPIVEGNDYFVQPSGSWGSYKEKVQVKGIYMTGKCVGYKPKFDELIELINETELNAIVIDIKDDIGEITYPTNVKMANEIGADRNVSVEKFDEVMDILYKYDIYPIARIVTFKDRIASTKRPDLAVKCKDGSVWRDNKGEAWLNPYNKESWEYPIQIAEEAAMKGFKEIQFDYVRFPTDGDRKLIDYGQAKDELTQAEAIAEFLEYARERLDPYGVYVSADVFGLVTTAQDDMNLGQHLETLATGVDILCPMVYPSHYALGSYGVKYPDAHPYEIVYHSLTVGNKRIDSVDSDYEKAFIRPWLQDFSAPWLKKQYGKYYTTYKSPQIKAQIKACYDSGLDEWLFWNAANKYTKDGFKEEK